MKIIITNSEYKHTLAAIRSLGRRGMEVTAASTIKHNMSFYSKYCKRRVIYSNPENESVFISDILDIVKKENYDVLLPIGHTTCLVISKYQERLRSYVKIPIASYESMQIASNKNRTIKFAEENDIPVPKTIFPESIRDVENVSRYIKYPIVIKPPEGSGTVKYANSGQELIELYKKACSSQIDVSKLPQIQEYIPGEGYGFFALFNHGEPRAIFAHKRLHEYPLTGGPSTMAQSVFYKELNEIGLKILKALDWHGVAMVEFKKDKRDDTLKLIEINPKFWGSLDLAIASGVDFPYLSSKMCKEGDIQPVFKYKEGLIFRWIFPDLVFSLAKNSLNEYIINFFNKNITDDLYFQDIRPTVLQCYKTIFEIAGHIKNRNLKYPHGKPILNGILEEIA